MRIDNVVGNCWVWKGHRQQHEKSVLNLGFLAKRLRNVEYRPRERHRLYIRLRNPRTTTIVYATGYMTLTGAKSARELIKGLRRIARLIQTQDDEYKQLKIGPISVQTMVPPTNCVRVFHCFTSM